MYTRETQRMSIELCIMLRLVLVLSSVYVAFAQQQQRGRFDDDFMRYKQECMDELKLNSSLFHFTQRDIIDNVRINGNSSAKCMPHCMFRKWGLLDPNDELQVEVVKKRMHFYDDGLVNLDRCKKIKALDKCDATLLVRRCIWNELANQKNHRLYVRMGEVCISELNLNYTLTQAVGYIAALDRDGDEVEEIDDKDARCLLACAMRKLRYFNDKGELQVEVLRVSVREMRDVDVEKCAKLKRNDACEQTLAIRRCLLDEIDKKQKPK